MKDQGQTKKNIFVEMEKEVLDFWDKNKIFEQTLDKESPKGDYVFYDGPPFATGMPHYGHLVGSIIKDVVPRFWTMNGYHVDRTWGWDCHGLPIENIVEKELGSESKKDIEEKVGIDIFNETCRSKVLSYVEDWKKVIRRLGRFVDMENAYKTMDMPFMESIWAVFKNLWDKGFVYKDYRSMHVCPRCETTLSQSEVSEGYKDVKDLTATVKFELVDEPGTFVLAWTTTPWTLPGNVALAVGKDEEIDYVKVEILKSKSEKLKKGEKYIFSKDFLNKKFVTTPKPLEESVGVNSFVDYFVKNNEYEGTEIRVNDFNINNLINKKYKPAFDYLNEIIDSDKTPRVLKKQNSSEGIEPQMARKIDCYTEKEWKKVNKEIDKSFNEVEKFKNNAYKIYYGNFVTKDEGTGIVHIAPAFGEDDMSLGKENNLPFVQHVELNGIFSEDLNEEFKGWVKRMEKEEGDEFDYGNYSEFNDKLNLGGLHVKPKDNIQATDVEIIKYLARKGLLFSKEKHKHSYPHCWRCETPLINYATSSWFINVKKLKGETDDKMGGKTLLETAKEINWSPEHLKDGRFGKWLEGARDWSISRQRFWASCLPIWECVCGERKVFGSVKELEDLSGEKINDLHKHTLDKIILKCEKCGGEMRRIPDVFDCWFESGSMPYASKHYPFENQEYVEKNFPADFIAEGVDQTRTWFYYLHVISGAIDFGKIKNSHAFKNVIVNGIVLAEDGKKMSKRLNNYPDPTHIFDTYGADALRYYLLTSPVMIADNFNFAEKGVSEYLRKLNNILWNTFKFYEMYSSNNLQSSIFNLQLSDLENVLDKWIIARLNQLIAEVTEGMEKYNLPKATRPIVEFIDDLSTWYLRRSRDRFKSGSLPLFEGESEGVNISDKQAALKTFGFVLLELSKVMAPFTPFIAEQLYQKITGYNFTDKNKSVHLEKWPKTETDWAGEIFVDVELLEKMKYVRKIVEFALAKRDEIGIKVRQPLLKIKAHSASLANGLDDVFKILIKDEVNVKEVICEKGDGELFVELDATMTPELIAEGVGREIVRFINSMRKENDLTIDDRIEIFYQAEGDIKEAIKTWSEQIIKETLANKISEGESNIKKEVDINGKNIILSIKKI